MKPRSRAGRRVRDDAAGDRAEVGGDERDLAAVALEHERAGEEAGVLAGGRRRCAPSPSCSSRWAG